jgi:hypothetical protein
MTEAIRARGHRALSPAEGLMVLLAGLSRGPAHLVVGLDGGAPRIARHGAGGSIARREVSVLYTTQRPDAPPIVDPPAVRDRFGVEGAAELHRVDCIPRTAGGEVDAAALVSSDRRPASRPTYVGPRDARERVIAGIWQEVLGVDRIGVLDNFFDVGGHSLMLAQVRGRLLEALGKDVPILDFFRYPSIRALSARLGDEGTERPAAPAVEDRARRQREAAARHRPVARPALGGAAHPRGRS